VYPGAFEQDVCGLHALPAARTGDTTLMGMHFTPEAIRFLRGLIRNNDREWFEARRETYERAVRSPMLGLIEQINADMAEFAPEHVRPAHKIMMRIYRDTRFSKDKRPYKRHVSAWWVRRGLNKTSGAGFYLQVNPQEVEIAAGVFMPEREQLLAIRQWMAAHHVTYRKTLDRVLKPRATQIAFAEVEAEALKRMPRGFAADHPAGELLRARNWGVHLSLPVEAALEPSLHAQVVGRFRHAAPLVEQLNNAILEADRETPLL
jgi:uncharacterized protein (TIGR02453 family)